MHSALIAEVFANAHQVGAAFAGFAQLAAPVAIAALWQSTAIAVGLALCMRLTPRLAAGHRFGVWAGGFAVAAGLQMTPLLLHFVRGAGTVTPGGTGAGSAFVPVLEFDARWTLVIAGIWLALTALRSADLAVHTLRLRKLWKNAKPIDGLFAERANGSGPVAVCTSTELDRPSVIGFFAPRILIPEWLYARLTQGELDQVILHECEHLRRRDDWTNLLQKLCVVAFPLNPALVWMEHRLCREREMACDEGVVRVTRAPRAYAACLASMAERRLEQSLARRAAVALSLGAFERRSELVGRVHSILRRTNFLGPVGTRAVLSVVGCGLLVGGVELARSPQMVGFVSAPVVAQTAPQAPATQERLAAMDNAVDGSNASTFNAAGFRAMNAMAVMPAAAHRQAHSRIVRNDAASDTATLESRIAPRQQLVKAAMDAPKGGARAHDEATPGEWIVLTTWQQVEAPAANKGIVADYNASADGDTDDSASQERTNGASQPIAVTQLILRFYSASADSGAANSKSGPANSASVPDRQSHPAMQNKPDQSQTGLKSLVGRRAVLPLGDGWLVIQL